MSKWSEWILIFVWTYPSSSCSSEFLSKANRQQFEQHNQWQFNANLSSIAKTRARGCLCTWFVFKVKMRDTASSPVCSVCFWVKVVWVSATCVRSLPELPCWHVYVHRFFLCFPVRVRREPSLRLPPTSPVSSLCPVRSSLHFLTQKSISWLQIFSVNCFQVLMGYSGVCLTWSLMPWALMPSSQ